MVAGKAQHRAAGGGLMVLDTPLLKVSRPVAACSRCRAAKIKCDGKLPACSACEKNGKSAECASANDNFARGKERSYVSTLETRVEKLERKLREAHGRKSSIMSAHDNEQSEDEQQQQQQQQQQQHQQHQQQQPKQQQSQSKKTSQPPTEEKTAGQKKARQREKLDIDDLVSDFGFLTVNATSRDYFGFTSFMSYARLILSACSKDPMPTSEVSALPPRHLATMTIQHYLDHIFTLLPFFDETTLYYSIDAVYKADSDPEAAATPFDHWSVRFILAISNAWMSEECGDQYYAEAVGHVAAALKYAEAVLRPGALISVQAMIFLAQYAMVDPHHFDSWSLIGAASRAMVDLGLHQDPPKGSSISRAKLELRRRVYYCVYMMDRVVSIVQGRTFSYSDDSANVAMPFTGAQTPKPSSYTSKWLRSFENARDLVQLRKLQSQWYSDLFQSGRDAWSNPYPYLWQTCNNLATWFGDTSSNMTASHRAWYELEVLYSYIYVLSPSPRVPVSHPYAQRLVFEHCISYAALMIKVIDNPKGLVPLSFYDAMRVYMTGKKFIDLLSHYRDTLLSGMPPELPPLHSTSPSPPPLPSIPIDPYNDALRSITCISQLSEALRYLGVRWGYTSWRENFDRIAEPLLATLHHRLWELQNIGHQRPSLVPRSSSGHSAPTIASSEYDRPSPYQRQSSGNSIATMSSGNRQTSFSHYPGYVTGEQLRAARQQSGSIPSHHAVANMSGQRLTPDGMMPGPQLGFQQPPLEYRQSIEDPGMQFAVWHGLDTFDPGQQRS